MIVGLVWPLTVRMRGRARSMSSGTVPCGVIWMSLSSMMRSVMPCELRERIEQALDHQAARQAAHHLPLGLPCRCVWYQYRPGLWLAGIATR